MTSSDQEIVFEIDEVELSIKPGNDMEDLPWRFEIVDSGNMTEKIETWLNEVNDEFSGKDRADPPSGFFDIIQEKYDEIFNAGWDDEDDEDPGAIGVVRGLS